MTSPLIPASMTGPQVPSVNGAAPSSSNAITAGAIAQSGGGGGLTSSTRINSLADLKKKAPEVYRKMLESIASNVCQEMREHQARLKKLMREGNAR